MSSCGYSSSCPEPVNVNITNQVIQIDERPLLHRVDNFNYGDLDSESHREATLSFYPYQKESVQIYLNSLALRYGIDYVVRGNVVVLSYPLSSSDQLSARYFSVENLSLQSIPRYPVGSITSFSPNAGFVDGFLKLDGVTTHQWSFYYTLKNWFFDSDFGAARRAELLLSYDDDTFILKLLSDANYQDGSLVSLSQYIRWSDS